MQFHRSFISIAAGLFSAGFLCFSSSAFAQEDCDGLGDNPNWNSTIQEIAKDIQLGRYQKANVSAVQLSQICSESPVLNYLRGKIAEGMKDRIQAIRYYQTASEAIGEFIISPELSRKIWYARYEAEHPERTGSSVESIQNENKSLLDDKQLLIDQNKNLENRAQLMQDRVELLKDNTESLKEEKKSLQEENKMLLSRTETVCRDRQLVAESKTNYTNMWIGASVGIVGLAVLGTGLGLALNYDSVKNKVNSEGKKVAVLSPIYSTGWALFGVGTTMTVIGTIMTGIYGYRYSQSKSANSYSFSITPTQVAFGMTF